jgi:hypothetical protein
MDIWNDNRFISLLTPTILCKTKSQIESLIIIAEKLDIDKYLTTSYLAKTPSHIYAINSFLNERHIPSVIDGKLHIFYNCSNATLKNKYKIDINNLIKLYPIPENFESEKKYGNI